MKLDVNKIPIEFCSTVLSVGEKLSPPSLLYWARNKEKLEELLEKKDFELITPRVIKSTSFIPSIPATTRKIVGSAGFWKKDLRNFIEEVPERYPETPQANVFPFQLNVRLHLRELFEEMGGREELFRSAFTYPQVHWLAAHENNRKSKIGILDFEQPNYLLIKLADRTVGLLHLTSREEKFHHKYWRVWLNGHDEILLEEGRFLLTESL